MGKSTLLAGLGREFGRPPFDLDQPETRAAAAADPGFFVSGPDPVLIDELVVMRDVLDIARIRQREALPRLLRQFAAQTGQLLNITKAGQAVGLESSTANRYATLLEAAFMIQRLPAWSETLGKRLSAHPKVHVIDSGLAGWLLGLSAAKINSRNPAALTSSDT